MYFNAFRQVRLWNKKYYIGYASSTRLFSLLSLSRSIQHLWELGQCSLYYLTTLRENIKQIESGKLALPQVGKEERKGFEMCVCVNVGISSASKLEHKGIASHPFRKL